MQITPEFYENLFGNLLVLVIAAMLLERALSIVFEWGLIEPMLTKYKLRAPLALLTAWLMCQTYGFDMLSVIFTKTAANTTPGILLTAATIAGGSKGAILLFQGILGFSKESVDASMGRNPDGSVTDKPFWQR